MKKIGCFLVGLVVFASTGSGQEKDAAPLGQFRLGDGSLLRMIVLQENLEIMTRYGKLTVPMRDIRKIEFGLHLPDEINQQIQAALKKLGSDMYKEREDASRELAALGPLAYPALQKIAKTTSDAEVGQRVLAVMKRIAEKASPEQLQIPEEDAIQTMAFPVTGKILAPAIKAKSAHFGEMALKLSELRTLHLQGVGNGTEVALDASLGQWFDTGLVVDGSQRLCVSCDGNVDLWPQGPGQYMTGPKGYTAAGKDGQFMAGALIGRIGDKGQPFLLGERFEGVPAQVGKLHLNIVASPWNNGSMGTYRVKIRTEYAVASK